MTVAPQSNTMRFLKATVILLASLVLVSPFEDATIDGRQRLRKSKGTKKSTSTSSSPKSKSKSNVSKKAKSPKSTVNRTRMTGDEPVEFVMIDKDELRGVDGSVAFAIEQLFYKTDNGICREFYTNPQYVPGANDAEKRNTWVKQVRNCGFYNGKMYQDSQCQNGISPPTIPRNVDNPGRGDSGDIVLDRLYRVEFDVGRHANMFGYSDKNVNFAAIDFSEGVAVPDATVMMQSMIFGETCLETFAYGGEDWGTKYGSNYDCMGYCGDGCRTWLVAGTALDCMKHDVCSYYKTWVQEAASGGFCADVDCGDEAAQTVINCWDENGWWLPTICREGDRDIYAEINPIARFLGRQACLDRTGWDRMQGMPRPWNFPE